VSSQVRPRPIPRPMPAPPSAPLPWMLVAVLIFGTGALCSAVLAWSFTLLVIGMALVAGALVSTMVRRSRTDD
jgi:hypothetical protein